MGLLELAHEIIVGPDCSGALDLTRVPAALRDVDLRLSTIVSCAR